MARKMTNLEYSYACELDRYRRIPEYDSCEVCGGDGIVDCDFDEFIILFDSQFREKFIKAGYKITPELSKEIKEFLKTYRQRGKKRWLYYRDCPNC